MRALVLCTAACFFSSCGEKEDNSGEWFPPIVECASDQLWVKNHCVDDWQADCCTCMTETFDYSGTALCYPDGKESCFLEPLLLAQCHCWDECAAACGDPPDECVLPDCPANAHPIDSENCGCDYGYQSDGNYCVMLRHHCGDGQCVGPCDSGYTGACAGTDPVCCPVDYPFGCASDNYCYAGQDGCQDAMPVNPTRCF